MTHITPDDAADCLRSEGWRQGCLIPPNHAEQIIESSIDFFSKSASSDAWLVVLTQDCDLVRKSQDEPYVELLAIQKLPNKSENPMRGQSARYLHLVFDVGNEMIWFYCNIHHRFRIEKNALCGLGCDTTQFFIENERRLLRQWLARRYARAAFPDYFETHLASTNDPVKKLFKSPAAKLISTIYIAIDNEDADSDEDYRIHVILTVQAKDFNDEKKIGLIDDFEQRLIQVFSKRPHITFALKNPDDPESYDVRVMPEEDITLSILRKYKRFDADYRSVDEDSSPPDGIDTH